mgnify:CR=1 FL=1
MAFVVDGEGELQQPPGRHELAGDRAVVRTRRGIAAGMVVDEHDRRGPLRDRLTEHLTRVHQRGVQDPSRDEHVAVEPVLRVEDRDVELLDRQVLEPRRVRAPHVARGTERFGEVHGLGRHAAGDGEADPRRGAAQQQHADDHQHDDEPGQGGTGQWALRLEPDEQRRGEGCGLFLKPL